MKLEPDADGSFTCPDDPGEPTTSVARVSVTPQECEILAELAKDRIVLEIGTGLGISTAALASTAMTVWTIDTDPWVKVNIAPRFDASLVQCAMDREWAPHGFELVFIDGDHQPGPLRADMLFAYEHLAPGGTIVCHDARYTHVWSVLCEFLDRGSWEYRGTAHGLAIQKVLV